MAKTASKSSKVSPPSGKKEAQKGKKKPGAPKSSDKTESRRSKTGKNVVDPLPGDPFEL